MQMEGVTTMRTLTLDWIAGFIEGEGGFSCSVNKRGSILTELHIAQNSPEMLLAIQDFFNERGISGKVYPVAKDSTGVPTCYVYKIFRQHHFLVAAKLLTPHLRSTSKRVQLGLALETLEEYYKYRKGRKVARPLLKVVEGAS